MAAANHQPLQHEQQHLAEEEAAPDDGHSPLAWLRSPPSSGSLTGVAAPPAPAAEGQWRKDRTAAFLAASMRGDAACMCALLDASLPSAICELVSATDEAHGLNALMHATFEGHAGCVQVLLCHAPCPQLSAVHRGGRNACMLAAMRGQAACMRLLLRHDPAPQLTAVDSHGNNAAMLAANFGRLECLQLLLAHSPSQQRLDEALAKAAEGWSADLEQSPPPQPALPYARCIELLLSKGAMLTAESRDTHVKLVRPIVRDVAARALAPEMAGAAAAAGLSLGGESAGMRAAAASKAGDGVQTEVAPLAAATPAAAAATGVQSAAASGRKVTTYITVIKRGRVGGDAAAANGLEAGAMSGQTKATAPALTSRKRERGASGGASL